MFRNLTIHSEQAYLTSLPLEEVQERLDQNMGRLSDVGTKLKHQEPFIGERLGDRFDMKVFQGRYTTFRVRGHLEEVDSGSMITMRFTSGTYPFVLVFVAFFLAIVVADILAPWTEPVLVEYALILAIPAFLTAFAVSNVKKNVDKVETFFIETFDAQAVGERK